jgi:Tfp pilus assembly pilus retraction ATPase PilT
MAKVIISTKNSKGKYAYKEVMMDQESVNEYIKENKS